jgi:diaminohydroxyphosphoribosylaminopyrimidine deaminase/5-amino-6-(5-phosphoribosylamino)uracil reductase
MSKIQGLPTITLKWAQTLDGQLADDNDQSQWISGVEERRYTHLLRSRHQAILVGAQTFLKDRCQLTVRDVEFDGLQPLRIIMDPRGRVLEAAKADPTLLIELNAGKRKTYLLTDIPDEEEEEFALEGLKNLQLLPYRFDSFNRWLKGVLSHLVATLEAQGEVRLQSLMVEGGASTLAAFLNAGIVDSLEIAMSPLILGGHRHRVHTGKLLKNVSRFEVGSQERLGADVLLRYHRTGVA